MGADKRLLATYRLVARFAGRRVVLLALLRAAFFTAFLATGLRTAFFAAFLAGKVPVNLNSTLSAEVLASCAKQCKLQTIVTSKTFLERLKVTLPCPTLLLEEVAAKPKLG